MRPFGVIRVIRGFSQNTYFKANCITRASSDWVINPNVSSELKITHGFNFTPCRLQQKGK